MSTNKEHLHHLIDSLSEDLAGEVLDFARYVQDRRQREANLPEGLRQATLDNEPFTDEERAEVAASLTEYREKGGVTLESLMAECDAMEG
ncbi:MAG TPA: hypothetical protein V6D47_22405 [Oscillatoriaceae cyanobacterium]